MHTTDFEPLISLPALLEGFVFGSLLTAGFFTIQPAGTGLFLLAAFLFFDAVMPFDGPAYIYEFLLAAVPGILLGLFSAGLFAVTLPIAVIGLLFLIRRVRAAF